MSETKFTPGPWESEVYDSDSHPGFDVFTQGDAEVRTSVAFCDLMGESEEQADETEANAALIAAAPEMFALLGELVAWHGLQIRHHDRAVALLDKARGFTVPSR